MKKILIIVGILLGLFLGYKYAFGATSVFKPFQLGGSASNGYVLQTDGTTDTWVATSTLGIISQWLNGASNAIYYSLGNVGIGSTTPSAPLVVSGQSIFGYLTATSTTNVSSIANLGGTLDASAFPGADIGAKINAAYAALPSYGGAIFVPGGNYTYTTPILFGTNFKVVKLVCASGGGGENFGLGGGTILTYTPSTGDAITVNTNNYVTAGAGIENCDIQGTNGTTARSTNGITLGGTNGAFSFNLNHVTISGFGTGYHLYQNTSFDTITDSVLNFNGRNIFIESTTGANGENFKVYGGVIADSNNQAGGATDKFCINNQLSGNTQVSFFGTSIDDCQYYSNQFGGTANITNFTNVHWENPNGHTYDYITTLASVPAVEININGGDFMNDVVGGMPEFITSGGDISMSNVTFDGNNNVVTATTRAVNNINTTNLNTVSWNGITSNGKGITYIYGTLPYSVWGYGIGNRQPSFFIASSTDATYGNVGIGSSTPNYSLSITGTSTINPFGIASSTGQTLFSLNQAGAVSLGNSFGSSGQVFTSQGTSSLPTWTTISGGGITNTNPLQATYFQATSTTATSTFPNLEGVFNASDFTGSSTNDIGDKVDAAYLALPSYGGTVNIPRGQYSFSTEIYAHTFGKPLTLNCDIGTTLTWTGAGTSTKFDFGQSSAANSSINNCKYIGPGTTTKAVAIELGGDNGARNFTLNNVNINNFGTVGAVTVGNNAYLLDFHNDTVDHNGKAFYNMGTVNQGEQLNFTGGNWADCKQVGGDALNCLDFGTGAENIRLINVGIEDAQLHFHATTRNVLISGANIESPAGDNIASYPYIVIDNDANTNVDIEGTSFVSGQTTNCAAQAIQNGATLVINGVTAEDYAGCHMANFITNTGNGWTKVTSINKQDSAYTSLYNSTGGTGSIHYSQEDNGNLGVGTSTPAYSLVATASSSLSGAGGILYSDQAKGVAAQSQVLLGAIKANDGSYVEPSIWLGTYASSPSFTNYVLNLDENGAGSILNAPGSKNLSLRMNNNTRAFISGANQNFGIGSTTPLSTFSITGSPGTTTMTVASSTGLTMLTLLQNGNFGIGTPNPSNALNVQKDDTGTGIMTIRNLNSAGYAAIDFYNDANTHTGGFGVGGTTTGAPYKNNFYFGTNAAGQNIIFLPNSVEAMRVLDNKTVGIGTTTPNAWFAIQSGATSTLSAFIVASSTGNEMFKVKNDGTLYAPQTTSSGANQTGYWCYDANGQFIRDTTTCLVSAAKFKTDIKPLDIGLTQLLKVQPVTYYNKDKSFGATQQIGVIADEVAKIDTRLIVYDNTGAIHGFNYEQYTAWITKAIQDFYGQFQKLVARVSGLEKKVNKQQQEIDHLQKEIDALKTH